MCFRVAFETEYVRRCQTTDPVNFTETLPGSYTEYQQWTSQPIAGLVIRPTIEGGEDRTSALVHAESFQVDVGSLARLAGASRYLCLL